MSIAGSGAGIDAETLPRIFAPFFTIKSAGKGTGLGLSTVYGIVTQSGGFIEVERRPENGSAFRVYLPTADGEVGESRTPLHLVLTDVVMAGMTGPELALRLKASRSACKFLFVSGYADAADLSAQNGDFISKPLAVGDLLKKVRQVLDLPPA